MDDKELRKEFQKFLNSISNDKSVILPIEISELLPSEKMQETNVKE